MKPARVKHYGLTRVNQAKSVTRPWSSSWTITIEVHLAPLRVDRSFVLTVKDVLGGWKRNG
jgi:hypothetical protein